MPGRRQRTLIIAPSLVGVLVAGGAVGVRVVQNRLTSNVEHLGDPFEALPSRPAPAPTTEAKSTPLNILVVGSDSRISAGDRASGKPARSARMDTLGGVEITLKQDLHNGHGTLLLPAGKYLRSGKDALVYVRERKSLARGDFDRVQRQQAWMRSIFARMRNEQTLQSPQKSVPFLNTVTKSIAADDGLTREVMNDVILRAKNVGSSDLGFFTVPIAGTGTSPSGQSIANLNQPAFDDLMAAVAADDVAGYLAAHPKTSICYPRLRRDRKPFGGMASS